MSDFFISTLAYVGRLSFVFDEQRLLFMNPGAFEQWQQHHADNLNALVGLPNTRQICASTELINLNELLSTLTKAGESIEETLNVEHADLSTEVNLRALMTDTQLLLLSLTVAEPQTHSNTQRHSSLYQSILRHTPVGIWYLNSSGQLDFFNDTFLDAIEQDSRDFDQVIHYAQCLPKAIALGCMASDLEVLKSRQAYTIKEYVRLKNGRIKYVDITKLPLIDEQGLMQGIIGIVSDMSEHQETKNALTHEKDRVMVTLSAIGDGVVTTNKQGIIDYVNPAAERLIACPSKEAIGQPINHVFKRKHAVSGANQTINIEQYLKPNMPLHDYARSILVNKEGNELSIQESIASIHDHSCRPTGLVITFKDNTETKRLTERLEHYSKHDNLTGLLNRQELCRIIDNEIKKTKTTALFFLIDIDQFKIIINTAGNSAGNFLLKFISNILSTMVTGNDYLGRLSSDVFGLIITGKKEDSAQLIARKVAQIFKDNPFDWKDRQYNLSSSIGIAYINNHTQSVDDIISQAHLACYAAKDSGRGHFHIYSNNDQPTFRLQDELTLVQDIDYALRNNTFELFCQPIVGMKDASTQRIEILIRLRNPAGDIIMPSQFIPVAENYGLMPNIDTWVLDNLVKLHHQDFLDRPDVVININLSGRSLSNRKLLRNIHHFLLKNPAISQRLCFEITETAAIKEMDGALTFMNALHTLGCQLALDDFGSGLSSFRYLKTLPVDILKIDGSFIINMETDKTDRAMVKSIYQVCKAMKVEVVAEYVETQALEHLVKTMGIDYAQGFYYSKPIPLEDYFDEHESRIDPP